MTVVGLHFVAGMLSRLLPSWLPLDEALLDNPALERHMIAINICERFSLGCLQLVPKFDVAPINYPSSMKLD
jgi:hypothetical protein